MKEYIVETRSLKKYYQMGENTVKALDGVDFRVKDQEFVAIIGKSGSGKSTLLHMLGGLDVPTEGEVLVEGKCLLGLKKEQLAIFRRRKIGFIFKIIILSRILMYMRMLFFRWNWMGERLMWSMWMGYSNF